LNISLSNCKSKIKICKFNESELFSKLKECEAKVNNLEISIETLSNKISSLQKENSECKSDLNDYKTFGVYRYSAGNASTISNRPLSANEAIVLWVMRSWDNSYIRQIAFMRNTQRIATRIFRDNTTWGLNKGLNVLGVGLMGASCALGPIAVLQY
jgi:ABC-type enterochelin transport system ATPase subunit